MRETDEGRDGRCPSEDALAVFVDGAASVAAQAALHAHVAACSRCAATLAAFARDFDDATLAARGEGEDATLAAGDAGGRGQAEGRARAREERYVFGKPFAAGGLGLVRRAEDRRLGRQVAVKELLLPSPAAERRFLREAAITARLQHPAIVPIYDIGRHPTGEPFYCMKLVEGRTLAAAIAGCDGLLARLGLLEHVIAAADAVAYAHRRSVVHRDLKPDNILIGEIGETVVIDWGLAKDLTGALVDEPEPGEATGPEEEAAPLTRVGVVMGTLRYMPPEQAIGAEVDARSDVFALGAVLFHVLAGQPPYADVHGPALLARVAEATPGDLRRLVPEAPTDLVAIAEKAMAAAPQRRYAGAAEFVEDLRRFRTGRLVGARDYSAGDVLRRWLARHRALVGVVGASLATLVVVATLAVQNIQRERDVAEEASRRADAEKARALAAEVVARDERAEAERQRGNAREHLVAAQGARATDAVQLGAANEALLAAGEALAIREDATARGALVAGASGLLEPLLWTAPLAARPAEIKWHARAGLLVLEQDRVERWTAAGEPLPALTGGGFAFAIEPSPDGRRIALDSSGALTIYEPEVKVDGPTLRIGEGVWTGAYGLVWRDADHVVSSDGALWELSTGRRTTGWSGRQVMVRAIAAGPDAALVVTGAHDHTVRAWDPFTFREIGPLAAAGVGAYSVAVAPDSRYAAAGGEVRGGDGKVRVWDLRTADLVDTFRAHHGEVHFVRFAPDGRWLATGGSDEVLRLWHVPSFTEAASLRSPGGRSPRFAFAPDGSALAVAFGGEQRLRVYSLRGSAGGLAPRHFPRPIERVAWSPDGRRVAASREDGTVHVFDTQTGAETVVGAGAGMLVGQVLAWVDERVLTVRGDHELVLVDPSTGAVVANVAAVDRPYQLTALSRSRLLVIERSGLRLIDVATPHAPARALDCPIVREPEVVRSLGVWTPDGTTALVMIEDGPVLRVPADGSPCEVVGPADTKIEALRLDPGGTLAAASTGEALLLLDYPAWTLRARLEVRRATISSLRFTADARFLLAADWSGQISAWRVADGQLFARWRGHQNRIWSMELSPDGRFVATGSADRTLRTWELAPLDLPREAVPAWVEASTGATLGR